MATYWDARVQVWGPEVAFRRIGLGEFEPEDQIALELGGIRFLPSLDNAGRGIIVVDRTRFDQRVERRSSMV